MENQAYNDPIDDHITNNDTAVTNKDGDNNLERGANPANENETENMPPVTPDNDVDAVTPTTEEKVPTENTSNKGQGPKGENL